MNIVILDGYTLNPGDLSWEGFHRLGAVTLYDRTPAELIAERSKDADILITNKTPLAEALIMQLPKLKYIGVLATGYNVVDVDAARRRNIPVANIPAYGTLSVAQMTFALILELCHQVQEHSRAVRAGAWTVSPDFCFWNYPLMELEGKTLGIIGYGRIGRQTAAVGRAFGMKILAHDHHCGEEDPANPFTWAGLEELLGNSDIVSLHCPLLPETKGIINKANLQRMKRSAFLINTSRGPLVEEEDLAWALNEGVIGGAGLDVLSVEPPPAGNPLLTAKNCIITPHISWATKEARARLMNIAVDNLRSFIDGKPVHIVN
ncbi:MAG: D-2-hydroxyacid dehydrogenase [Paenibacillaceae bacterium]|jgi:glycerate dehydrogenase|nr:D-2-hydroxyacid dehydrogenase [Paenibacillaceae bacterium]